jgi:predicted metal-binding protein
MAKKFGALDAKLIRADSITTGSWVRMKCHFGCYGYNTSFCCPPHTPTPREHSGGARLLRHCPACALPTHRTTHQSGCQAGEGDLPDGILQGTGLWVRAV